MVCVAGSRRLLDRPQADRMRDTPPMIPRSREWATYGGLRAAQQPDLPSRHCRLGCLPGPALDGATGESRHSAHRRPLLGVDAHPRSRHGRPRAGGGFGPTCRLGGPGAPAPRDRLARRIIAGIDDREFHGGSRSRGRRRAAGQDGGQCRSGTGSTGPWLCRPRRTVAGHGAGHARGPGHREPHRCIAGERAGCASGHRMADSGAGARRHGPRHLVVAAGGCRPAASRPASLCHQRASASPRRANAIHADPRCSRAR